MTLDECLAGVLDSLEEDHRRVDAALRGVQGPLPRDPELAALVRTINSAPAPVTLLEVAVDHPDAAFQHAEWAAELSMREFSDVSWCIDLTTPQRLSLAS